MKMFVIITAILFQKYMLHYSYGSVLDYMSSKLGEFADSISTTFKYVSDKVNHFFLERIMDKHHLNKISQKVRKSVAEKKVRCSEQSTDNEGSSDTKPEAADFMSISQMIESHGRKVESHVIHTQDGYLITLHRIVEPIPSHNSDINGTILLHHGLLGSSADWVLLGPNKSLPYILSETGYDVWMINSRGNYYSRGHMTKKVDTLEYWDFSFQEIGQFDLRATIDYIRSIKKIHQINFIGHSLGATALLVLLSTEPEYNEYLKIGILLAPLVFMMNVKGPLQKSISMPDDELLTIFGEGEFVRQISDSLAFKYCTGPKLYCSNPLMFLCGIPENIDWNVTFIANLLHHVPAGGSAKTLQHYTQLTKNGNFHKFGDASSEFDLSQVTLPLVMFSSSEDWISTVPDVLKLYFSIKKPKDHYLIRGKKISHTEFIWSSKAFSLIFPKIIEYLANNAKQPTRTTPLSLIDLQSSDIFS